jgi:hypothetical protein
MPQVVLEDFPSSIVADSLNVRLFYDKLIDLLRKAGLGIEFHLYQFMPWDTLIGRR